MQKLFTTIFRLLKRMDMEANKLVRDQHTGLYWYGGYAKPEQKKPQTEACWTKRLAELLREEGYQVKDETQYPGLPKGRKNRCDLVIELSDNGKLWLEIKGAWKSYWYSRKKQSIYKSYLFYPLKPGLMEKSHATALDLEKLEQIRPPYGTCTGLLLIGFDSMEYPMDNDITEFIRLAGLDNSPWESAYDGWDDAYRDGERVRCWGWWRLIKVMDK